MLRFEIVNTLEEAELYWKKFSPQKTICDSWEYRYNFYKYLKFEIVFFVGFENDIPIGVLPLQRNRHSKSLEFFGGSYMEDNTVFVQSGYEFAIQNFINKYKNNVGLNISQQKMPIPKLYHYLIINIFFLLRDFILLKNIWQNISMEKLEARCAVNYESLNTTV